MQIGIHMRERERMIRRMVSVFKFMLMGEGMKEIGKTTSKMEQVLKL